MVREIQALWNGGEEVRGWARYWAMIYGYLADLLERDAALRDAAMILRYEDLCDRPEDIMRRMMAHCGLSIAPEVIAAYSEKLRPPAYYRPDFSGREHAAIAAETAACSARLGYRTSCGDAA